MSQTSIVPISDLVFFWHLNLALIELLTLSALVAHRSIQSQLQTKKFPGIWHMPNYSLISWVPKTGKNKKIQRHPKKLGPIKVFSI